MKELIDFFLHILCLYVDIYSCDLGPNDLPELFFIVDVSAKNKLVIEKYNVCNFLLNTKMLENC